MSGSLFPAPLQYFDDNGNPLAGGFVYTYVAGTSTLKASYSDYALSSLNTNPVELDAAGRADIWGEGAYKVIVKNSSGSTLSTQDNVILRPDLPAASTGVSKYLSSDGTDYTWAEFDAAWWNSIGGDRPYRLITEFADVTADDAGFDNSVGFQAALDYVAGTGVTLIVPPGTYYFGNGITLNEDNVLLGYNSRNTILQSNAAVTLVTILNNQRANALVFGQFTLTGSSSSDAASIGIQLGTSGGAGNFTVTVADVNFTSDTWYKGVYAVDELDNTILDNLKNLGGVFGYAFIDINLGVSGIAPTAAMTIRNCHSGNQQNAAYGKNRYGIRLQGTQATKLENNLMSGYDVCYAMWSQQDGGRLSYTTHLDNCLSEDFRTFASDFLSADRSTAYVVGNRRVPTTPNGFVYRCTTAGTTGGSNPVWSTTIGGTTTDGAAVWTTNGYHSRRWTAATSFPVGYLVKATKANANGWIFESSGGTTGATEPAWSGCVGIDYGTTFVDGTITWTAIHQSVGLQMRGAATNQKVVATSQQFGPVLVQYSMEGGELLMDGCDTYLGASNNASDISFRFAGADKNGNLIARGSRMRGNFKPYVTNPGDTYYCSVLLQNTRISEDLLDLVETSGEGIYGYYLGDVNRPTGGGATQNGTFTVSPISDKNITCDGASTITLADSNAMHKGKTITITALTSGGVTITLASGSFNFMGYTMSSITLPKSSSFVTLLAKTSGYEIQASTRYNPAGMRETQTSGTNGGSFTSGSYVARLFNEEIDVSAFVTTAGSSWTSFSLPPGVYVARSIAPAFNVGFHQTALQNTTAGTTLASGTLATTGAGVQSQSQIDRQFQLTATSDLELQHKCQTTNATDGKGAAGSLGTEMFSQIMIEKLI